MLENQTFPNKSVGFSKNSYSHFPTFWNLMDYKKEFKKLLELVRGKLILADQPSRNEDLASMMGYNRSYFSTLLGEKGVVTSDHIRSLILLHPWLNKHTSLELDIPTLENITGNDSLTLHEDEPKSYLEVRRQKKNSTQPYMVPLVPVKAQAGYARSYDDVNFINQLDLYPILPGIDHRGQVWRYFEIQGDSMEPALFDRDFVLVSMVSPEDWSELKNNQVYVIVTEKDVLIKKVHRRDEETWILSSTNKRHKQRAIAVKDIKEVWLFRRAVSSKLKV